ncbi:EamA family transporter RarD [Microbacterium sp. SYP-A9085]|uniref:EamA family transporter RarD n=1 Tax=Microbacterium sp. SYP-A9085 TaxID=2664454 RepID=UPI00132241F4|nr:EamA family transporter RarD [Microbacterium sp. SYP-A9085]
MRSTAGRSDTAVGGVYAFVAYLLWGAFPLYFITLLPAGPWEVVAWRVLLALLFCVLALTVTRGWRAIGRVVRQPRLLGWTAVAGVLIFVNWTVYLIATLTGHVIEASLGYFINPIVTVLLGVLVLHERLRVAQWIAIGVALVAVVVIVVGYGQVPWIALGLAFSFGLYGLAKNRVGPSVDALTGLTLETAWLAPVAAGMLVWVSATGGITFGAYGTGHAVLLGSAGVITAVPLLFFAAATRRAPLSLIGLLQFLTPILQFITGVVILHEEMSNERWIGFALVWVALVILTADSLRQARRNRTPAEIAEVV